MVGFMVTVEVQKYSQTMTIHYTTTEKSWLELGTILVFH